MHVHTLKLNIGIDSSFTLASIEANDSIYLSIYLTTCVIQYNTIIYTYMNIMSYIYISIYIFSFQLPRFFLGYITHDV